MEAALQVPMANILAMVTTLLISVGVPIALCIILWKRYKASVKSFFIGCGIFILFALILEQIMHLFVLGALGGVSAAISGNIWLYALYGSLAAALFEETGRLVAMKVFMKNRLNKENALMYGAGHGGIEAILIVGISYISNLLVVFMINSGAMEAQFAAEGGDVLYQQIAPLATYPSSQFYLAGVERLLTICLHIALSILVYTAVKYAGKRYCFLLAILFHFGVNFIAVVMASKFPLWSVEAVILVLVGLVVLAAGKFYKEDTAQ